MIAYLLRTEVADDCVRGVLTINGTNFVTLEPPWRFNLSNISCIPVGHYEATYLHRSASGKYKQVYHVQKVDGRKGILIHAGNLVRHTRGCILLGKRKGILAGQKAVLNSKSAMAEFKEIVGETTLDIEIFGEQHA